MKSNINLYHPRFAPKVDYLALPSITFVFVVCASVMLLIGLSAHFMASRAENAYAAVETQNRMLQSQVDMLQAEVSNWKPDEALTTEVEDITRNLEKQERVLEELRRRSPLRYKGFSMLFNDLANESSSDLWLESIMVSEARMDFTGEVSSPAAFPQWLQRLSNTTSFNGKHFEEAKVFLKDDGLKFELRTLRAAENTSGVAP